MTKQPQEPQELTHEPVKGYPTAFYLTVAVATIYLVIIFGISLW